MIYRIINGQKKLVADVSKLLSVNNKAPIGTTIDPAKNITLTGSDINWAATIPIGDDAETIEEKLNQLNQAITLNKGTVLTVNEVEPTPDGNVEVYAGDIYTNSNQKELGENGETVGGLLFDLKTKSHVKSEDPFLSWPGAGSTEGVSATIGLNYNGLTGELELLGKDEEVVDTINLNLQSNIAYAGVHKYNGNWDAAAPENLDAPSEYASGTHIYLVIGFKQPETTTIRYTFASLEELIDDYSAGNGLGSQPGNGGGTEFFVKKDPASNYELVVSAGGIKLEAMNFGTVAEMDTWISSNSIQNGVVYILDDAE